LGTIGGAEEILASFVRGLRLALEAVGAFWIAIGFVYSLIELTTAHLRRHTSSFTAIRLTFSRYLSLALEFQLASDILSTAIAPTWQEIGKLGALAVIRTALNYVLGRDMQEYKEKEHRGERQVEHMAGPPAEA
jgi:uncharacterized membrane protein